MPSTARSADGAAMTDQSPAAGDAANHSIQTDIPARLDRLPWTAFHWFLIIALGVTWVLDGLEVTVVSAVGNAALRKSTLGLTAAELGVAQTGYLFGAIGGALVFGHLTDRLGRKKLFTVTLLLYLCGALLTAFSWNFVSFAIFRMITGMAIGGEYAAINSAIDELIPARVRGRVDLAINGTFWLGAMAGAAVSVPLLNTALLPEWLGWRLAFGLGGVVGLVVVIARRFVPESPRWLLTHGREKEAEEIMTSIEKHAVGHKLGPVIGRLTLNPATQIGFGTIMHAMFVKYRLRAVLGLVLISSQAFFYNGVSFSFPLVLGKDYQVPADHVGYYVLIMAATNLLGPLLLGPLFDTVGRRRMIAGTYAISAIIIGGTLPLFLQDKLTAQTQTLVWAATFFCASAAASAGYLTVSEIFPLEMRALAIALFYAIGTAIGGLGAPALFGRLLESGRGPLAGGYLFGAALMLAAAAVEWWLGLDTEQKSLEDIAAPLTSSQR